MPRIVPYRGETCLSRPFSNLKRVTQVSPLQDGARSLQRPARAVVVVDELLRVGGVGDLQRRWVPFQRFVGTERGDAEEGALGQERAVGERRADCGGVVFQARFDPLALVAGGGGEA